MNLQELQASLAEIVGSDFASASNHPYTCACNQCRDWWLRMGPEPEDMDFGPFGDELWEEYADKHNLTVEEAKKMIEGG